MSIRMQPKCVQAVRTTTDEIEDEGCAWFLGSVLEVRDQEDKWFTDLLIMVFPNRHWCRYNSNNRAHIPKPAPASTFE